MQLHKVYTKQITCALIVVLGFLITAKATAQHSKEDSLANYRAIAGLWKLYRQKPIQLGIVIHHATTPLLRETDSSRSKLSLYLGEHDYYLLADGLEMILNDSLSLMINHPGHRMMLYENRNPLNQQLLGPLTAMAADSSILHLAKSYQASHETLAGHQELFRLTSREQVAGIGLPRETVWVVYKAGSADPAEYGTRHTTLIPVDSAIWTGWQKNEAFAGKLVRLPVTGNGWMYFLAREETTVYEFTTVSRRPKKPPVVLTDRLQLVTGQYTPAKEYEGYLFTKEY